MFRTVEQSLMKETRVSPREMPTKDYGQEEKCPQAVPHLLEEVRNSITVDFPEGRVMRHVTSSL